MLQRITAEMNAAIAACDVIKQPINAGTWGGLWEARRVSRQGGREAGRRKGLPGERDREGGGGGGGGGGWRLEGSTFKVPPHSLFQLFSPQCRARTPNELSGSCFHQRCTESPSGKEDSLSLVKGPSTFEVRILFYHSTQQYGDISRLGKAGRIPSIRASLRHLKYALNWWPHQLHSRSAVSRRRAVIPESL